MNFFVPILPVFGAIEVHCMSIIRTYIGKKDVFTILSDNHRLVDEILYFKHRFRPKMGNLTPKTSAEKCPFYDFSALRRSLARQF